MNSRKIVVSLALSLGIVITAPTFNQVAYANTTSEIEAERSLLQSEIEEKQEELEEVQAELVRLADEVERVENTIKENEMMIQDTEEEVSEREEEVKELEEEIEVLEEDIERRNDILKDRMSALQRNGGALSYLDVILGSQNFTDLIDRIAMVARITQADNSLIENLKLDQEQVELQKDQVEEKLIELEHVRDELIMMQGMILEQKEAHEENIAELERKEANSQALIEELEVEDRELEQMLETARREAERRAQQEREEAARQAAEVVDNSNDTGSGSTDSTGSIQQYSGSSSNANINNIISAGYKYIGESSYGFGRGRSQSDIAAGVFDCSAYTAWAFRQEGIHIPSTTSGQSSAGRQVSPSERQPGDLVFFDTYAVNGHVGIYIGNNKFIGSQSSTGVAIADMSSGYWANTFNGLVRRVVN